MKRVVFQLSINNIFNNKYINNGYAGVSLFENGTSTPRQESWVYYYPQAGTHFSGKITLNF